MIHETAARKSGNILAYFECVLGIVLIDEHNRAY